MEEWQMTMLWMVGFAVLVLLVLWAYNWDVRCLFAQCMIVKDNAVTITTTVAGK